MSRVPAVARTVFAGAVVLLASGWAAVGAQASTQGSLQQRRGWSCAMTTSSVTITLSDHSPAPSIRVAVGEIVSVLVPPWRGSGSTPVIASSAALRATCTVESSDGWRRAVFLGVDAGRVTLSSSAAPASDLMTPAWQGVVTVVAAAPHALPGRGARRS